MHQGRHRACDAGRPKPRPPHPSRPHPKQPEQPPGPAQPDEPPVAPYGEGVPHPGRVVGRARVPRPCRAGPTRRGSPAPAARTDGDRR